MSTQTLPVAPEAYDRLNEQRTRTSIEERITDIEAALYGLRTTYGTVSLGEGSMVLANGTNSNIPPGYYTYIRITGPTGSFETTGFTQGERGRLLLVANTTSQQWTIVNDATSTAANRILTGTGGNVVLPAADGAHAIFVYDSVSERWRLFAIDIL
jgi:dipeptidyl aminopeptidase/acylaminoacyl peptidase